MKNYFFIPVIIILISCSTLKIVETDINSGLLGELRKNGIVDFKNDYTIWINGIYVKANKFGIIDYFIDNNFVYIITYFPNFSILKVNSQNLNIDKIWSFNEITDFKRDFIEDDEENKKNNYEKYFKDYKVFHIKKDGKNYFSIGNYFFLNISTDINTDSNIKTDETYNNIKTDEEVWKYIDCGNEIKKIFFIENKIYLLSSKGIININLNDKIKYKYIYKTKNETIYDGIYDGEKIIFSTYNKDKYYLNEYLFPEKIAKRIDEGLFAFVDNIINKEIIKLDPKEFFQNFNIEKNQKNKTSIKDYILSINIDSIDSRFISIYSLLSENFNKYNLKIYNNYILNFIEETTFYNFNDENINFDKNIIKSLTTDIVLKRYKYLSTHPLLRTPYKRLDIDFKKFEKDQVYKINGIDNELFQKYNSEKLSTLYWYKNIETKKTFKLELVFGEKNVINMLSFPEKISCLNDIKVALIKYYNGKMFYKDIYFISYK